MPKRLTQNELKQLLEYDPETGVFTWRIGRGGQKAGKIAGTISHGYRQIRVKDKIYHASRLAHLYIKGYLPEFDMDHKDRIRDNDTWSNLRHISRSCNNKNSKIRKTNKSGITGVCWHKLANKWEVYIKLPKQKKHLGLFIKLIDAVKARWEAEKKYGWPNCNTKSSAFLYIQKYEGGKKNARKNNSLGS